MTSIDAFAPLVYAQVIGCPEPLAYQALRWAAAEFCRRTDIVQRIQAPLDTAANVEDYAITVPTDMRLARLLGAHWQGAWLPPVPAEQVASDVALRGATIGTAKVATGSPRWCFLKTPDATSVSLYPVPDTSSVGTITLVASFAPTMAAATFDDLLFNEWSEPIVAGAVGKIKSIQGQPFTANPAAALSAFERGVSAARNNRILGKLPNYARVLPRRFV